MVVISVMIGNGVKFKLQMEASVKMHTGLLSIAYQVFYLLTMIFRLNIKPLLHSMRI